MAVPIYPGYPETRLVITDIETLDNLTLPDGEWTTSVTTFPSDQEQQRLQEIGCELDNFGRPLHPWLVEMLTNPEVGVVTGLGEYWHWGPNETGDPVVIGNDNGVSKVLLVKRGDTGSWALPGGYVDSGETGRQAARRELSEETGVLVATEGHEFYSGPVADLRATAHAWPETTGVVWRTDSIPEPAPSDDAVEAKWFALDELPDNLHGSHRLLIEKSAEEVENLPIVPAFSLPEKTVSYRIASGGHMAYSRFLVTTDEGEVFVKSHDKQAFTDQFREERSRKYLQKEMYVYDRVAAHRPDLLPAFVRIIDDHSLVMEALSAENGWQWRAPREDLDRYVEEVAAHLAELQTIPLPHEKFRSHMRPTYDTHKIEGWNTIDNTIQAAITARLLEFQPKLRHEFQNLTKELIRDIPTLRYEFKELDEPLEYYFCHHDLRPANLAWHPDHGTKIIDWSWAGAGRKNSDMTTLLIDLHKAGHDVQKYMDQFNPDHALVLIGFWLAHSLWPTRTDDQSVRLHQVASAVSAYDLMMKYGQR